MNPPQPELAYPTASLRDAAAFFSLTLALSVPFLVLGGLTGRALMPNLPIAALQAVCPALAAFVLSWRRGGRAGASRLLRRSLDVRRWPSAGWLAPALLLAPAVGAVTFCVSQLSGTHLPIPRIEILPLIGLCAVFFVGAVCEELGWSGYVLAPLQARFGALSASLLVGVVWVIFHYVALMQAHHAAAWIAWWTVGTLALRVVLVWLYNGAGGSVLAAALLHMAVNVTWQTFPVHGSFLDQRIYGLVWALVAAGVVVIWGPRTLAGRRGASP